MDNKSENSLLDNIEVNDHPEDFDEISAPSDSNVSDLQAKEEKLRQKLKFFYMNPIEKWQFRQRFPYKFLVQLIKIVVVTLQACLFAHYRSFYVDLINDHKIAFSHLFLQNWDPSNDIISYPPQSGDLAVYTISDFYSAIDFAVINYANLNKSIGSYFYVKENGTVAPLEFCIFSFKKCDIFGFNDSYVLDNSITKACINITEQNFMNFSSQTFFFQNNFKIQFAALIEAKLSFGVKTINLKPFSPKSLPGCFFFNLTIMFNNQNHCGKVKQSLNVNVFRLQCKGTTNYKSDSDLQWLFYSLLNSVVIAFCLLSFILCCRAVIKAEILRRKTVKFFKNYYNKELSWSEKFEFINLWYVTMILSDIIVIAGSGLKEKIEKNEFSGDEWNVCSALLGVGNFLIWFCILRYLGFFQTYNIIVLTMKVAAPIVLRFMVCTFFIYAGFTFCGWLVLGPYHNKFRTLSITSECLFALMNGDDVFGTFITLEPTNSMVMWWFCQIYLYIFVSLFIFVILSLFITVISDVYETIKRYYAEGFPKNSIQEFIEGNFYKGLSSDSASSSSSLAHDIYYFNSIIDRFRNLFSKCCGGDVTRHKSLSVEFSPAVN